MVVDQSNLLPEWDLTPIFPSLESPEFNDAFESLCELTDGTVARFDQLHIDGTQAGNTPVDLLVAAFEEVIERLSEIDDRAETLYSYLYAVTSVDTRNEVAQTKMSDFEQRMVAIAKLQPRLTAWLGAIDQMKLLSGSAVAREHEHLVRRAIVESQHLMSPAEESLAAELHTSSGSSWTRMYDNVSSQIAAKIEIDGDIQIIAMPELRLLALDGRRDVRRRAHEAELMAWEANAVPLAAALNGIKGETLTLLKHRNWETAIKRAVFVNGIDEVVLQVMLEAAQEFFPDAHTYYRAKAGIIGVERLAWFDLFAPIETGVKTDWTWARSNELILRTFRSFSPRLGGLAQRAFDEKWIDASPRPGKSDGAYCTQVLPGVSRIMMNYAPSFNATSTLAHELGHAYHVLALELRPPLLRSTPSTLAETASIFCETLIRQEALALANEAQELEILEGSLQDSTQVIVDIMSRYLFEQRLFAARREHDVPISELCQLMRQTQLETYGNAIREDSLHSYMWAAKGHYYDVDEAFYNFPYMFGLLFALGLYDFFQREPEGFVERYDRLLSSTGMADARTLAEQFRIDLRSIDFWRTSLDVIRRDIRRYVELAGANS